MAKLLLLLYRVILLCTSSLGVLTFLSYKDTSHIGLQPALRASFYLNYLLKKSYLQIQSHSEILRSKISIMNGGVGRVGTILHVTEGMSPLRFSHTLGGLSPLVYVLLLLPVIPTSVI